MKKVEAVALFKEECAGLIATGNLEEISYRWEIHIGNLVSNECITIRQYETWKEPKWEVPEVAPVVLITEEQIELVYDAHTNDIGGATVISYYHFDGIVSLNQKYINKISGNPEQVKLMNGSLPVDMIVELLEKKSVDAASYGFNW